MKSTDWPHAADYLCFRKDFVAQVAASPKNDARKMQDLITARRCMMKQGKLIFDGSRNIRNFVIFQQTSSSHEKYQNEIKCLNQNQMDSEI